MNLILGGNPAAGAPGAAGAGGADPPNSIRVSPEEMEAINRIASLGFPKHKAAEAYFACDKNEEFAANYLFETAGQDDEEMMAAATANSMGAPAQAAAPAQAPAQPAQQPASENPAPAQNPAPAEGQQ